MAHHIVTRQRADRNLGKPADLLLWTLLGTVAGWVTSILAGMSSIYGLSLTIGVGILGACAGGWMSRSIGMGTEPGVQHPTWLVDLFWSFVGAVIVLLIAAIFIF